MVGGGQGGDGVMSGDTIVCPCLPGHTMERPLPVSGVMFLRCRLGYQRSTSPGSLALRLSYIIT